MIDFAKLIAECDDQIRSGHRQQVYVRFSKINTAKVPREWRLPLAKLCRRAGLYSRGLTLLSANVNPIYNPSGASVQANEVAEYGVLLLRAGAANEAAKLLVSVDTSKAPEALLYRSFLHFSRFEFTIAIALLERYLKEPIDSYARHVGRANLGFALAGAGLGAEAKDCLEETLNSDETSLRLKSHCHSIRAKVHLHERDFNAARNDLDAADRLKTSLSTHDRTDTLKWRAFLESLETGSTEPVNRFREHAILVNDYDGIREADLYSLRVKFNNVLFKHLVFGSPFEEFRRQICLEFDQSPDQKTYILGPKASRRFDLLTGKIDGENSLAPGRKCHQLIDILLRDFYSPLRIAGLFSELFPTEHFDVASSPLRVRQLIRRTRRWLESERIPVSIHEQRTYYSLRINGDFSFRVPFLRHQVDFMSLHFESLVDAFKPSGEFTAKEARLRVGLSRTTIQRLVNWGLESGRLQRVGVGNHTFYRVTIASQTSSRVA